MSTNLPITYNFGSQLQEDNPQLARNLEDMYTNIVDALNQTMKKNVISGANPLANDQRNSYFSIGDITVRTDTNGVWVLTSRTTPNAVTWTAV